MRSHLSHRVIRGSPLCRMQKPEERHYRSAPPPLMRAAVSLDGGRPRHGRTGGWSADPHREGFKERCGVANGSIRALRQRAVWRASFRGQNERSCGRSHLSHGAWKFDGHRDGANGVPTACCTRSEEKRDAHKEEKREAKKKGRHQRVCEKEAMTTTTTTTC